MSKDKNFERRMIVSKYSNRPPFDLKKPKEFYNIEDKIKDYPREDCKNCCANRSGDITNITKPIIKEYTEEPAKISSANKVIPKIIENFQKLMPANHPTEATMSKNTSIQTLYRNTTACNLGRNIPRHKLMESLLQNLDPDVENSKKKLADYASKKKDFSRKSKKLKKSKLQFFDKDEIIRPDFDVNIGSKQTNESTLSKKLEDPFKNCYKIPQKIDKKTSTTGLIWPPKSREVLQYHSVKSFNNHALNQMSCLSCKCGKIGTVRNTSSCNNSNKDHRKNVKSKFSSDSFLEEIPTKDVPQNQKYEVEVNASNKLLRNRNDYYSRKQTIEPVKPNCRNSQLNFKTEHNNSTSKCHIETCANNLRSKEKTFVQTQVERLNKVMRRTKIPNPRPPNQFENHLGRDSGNNPHQNFRDRGQEDISKRNYIGLIDQLRNNCPQFNSLNNCQSFESDNGWSSTTETEIIPEHLRFPKETKTAVEQQLSKKQRVPLSKLAKVHEHCRPAILSNIKYARDHQYLEEYKNDSVEDNFKGHLPQERDSQPRSRPIPNSGLRQNKMKLMVPCRKNLLCDKGERHSGPCGYTHNQNKVIY